MAGKEELASQILEDIGSNIFNVFDSNSILNTMAPKGADNIAAARARGFITKYGQEKYDNLVKNVINKNLEDYIITFADNAMNMGDKSVSPLRNGEEIPSFYKKTEDGKIVKTGKGENFIQEQDNYRKNFIDYYNKAKEINPSIVKDIKDIERVDIGILGNFGGDSLKHSMNSSGARLHMYDSMNRYYGAEGNTTIDILEEMYRKNIKYSNGDYNKIFNGLDDFGNLERTNDFFNSWGINGGAGISSKVRTEYEKNGMSIKEAGEHLQNLINNEINKNFEEAVANGSTDIFNTKEGWTQAYDFVNGKGSANKFFEETARKNSFTSQQAEMYDAYAENNGLKTILELSDEESTRRAENKILQNEMDGARVERQYHTERQQELENVFAGMDAPEWKYRNDEVWKNQQRIAEEIRSPTHGKPRQNRKNKRKPLTIEEVKKHDESILNSRNNGERLDPAFKTSSELFEEDIINSVRKGESLSNNKVKDNLFKRITGKNREQTAEDILNRRIENNIFDDDTKVLADIRGGYESLIDDQIKNNVKNSSNKVDFDSPLAKEFDNVFGENALGEYYEKEIGSSFGLGKKGAVNFSQEDLKRYEAYAKENGLKDVKTIKKERILNDIKAGNVLTESELYNPETNVHNRAFGKRAGSFINDYGFDEYRNIIEGSINDDLKNKKTFTKKDRIKAINNLGGDADRFNQMYEEEAKRKIAESSDWQEWTKWRNQYNEYADANGLKNTEAIRIENRERRQKAETEAKKKEAVFEAKQKQYNKWSEEIESKFTLKDDVNGFDQEFINRYNNFAKEIGEEDFDSRINVVRQKKEKELIEEDEKRAKEKRESQKKLNKDRRAKIEIEKENQRRSEFDSRANRSSNIDDIPFYDDVEQELNNEVWNSRANRSNNIDDIPFYDDIENEVDKIYREKWNRNDGPNKKYRDAYHKRRAAEKQVLKDMDFVGGVTIGGKTFHIKKAKAIVQDFFDKDYRAKVRDNREIKKKRRKIEEDNVKARKENVEIKKRNEEKRKSNEEKKKRNKEIKKRNAEKLKNDPNIDKSKLETYEKLEKFEKLKKEVELPEYRKTHLDKFNEALERIKKYDEDVIKYGHLEEEDINRFGSHHTENIDGTHRDGDVDVSKEYNFGHDDFDEKDLNDFANKRYTKEELKQIREFERWGWTDEEIDNYFQRVDKDVYKKDLIDKHVKEKEAKKAKDAKKKKEAKKQAKIDKRKSRAELDNTTPSLKGGLSRMGLINLGMSAAFGYGTYKDARRNGSTVFGGLARAGIDFALGEFLGPWYMAYGLAKQLPQMAVQGFEGLAKLSRDQNNMQRYEAFNYAQFQDTQQLATMRQSGMEMAKMANYNLQQTLMGTEAKYLHK